jgi:uncharacterized phage protein gp47/JayE
MLSYVKEQYPELDVREGSIIYTALAPAAAELATAYYEMEMIDEQSFISTASKEYLVKHGDQIGVELNEATYAHFEGEFNVELDNGTRFNLGEFNYAVIDKLSDPADESDYYRYELVCETAGSAPNPYLGTLTQITFVNGLTHAELTKVITYGEDEEETESYRYRLQTHIKEPPVNGNVAQYNEWLDAYPEGGIGKYKVIPCWNGVNTVKLLILSSENTGASDELVSKVQEYFDPIASQGMGDGVAPIGAVITVDTVTEVPVQIQCELVRNPDYAEITGVQEAVKAYLNSLVLNSTTVEYMPIWAEIYNVESVASIKSLSVVVNTTNGVEIMDSTADPLTAKVDIGEDAIPVLDTEFSVWGE